MVLTRAQLDYCRYNNITKNYIYNYLPPNPPTTYCCATNDYSPNAGLSSIQSFTATPATWSNAAQIVIDFGKSVINRKITFTILRSTRLNINPPTAISIAFSDNGITYGNSYAVDIATAIAQSGLTTPYDELETSIYGRNSVTSPISSPQCNRVFEPARYAKITVACAPTTTPGTCGIADIVFRGPKPCTGACVQVPVPYRRNGRRGRRGRVYGNRARKMGKGGKGRRRGFW